MTPVSEIKQRQDIVYIEVIALALSECDLKTRLNVCKLNIGCPEFNGWQKEKSSLVIS